MVPSDPWGNDEQTYVSSKSIQPEEVALIGRVLCLLSLCLLVSQGLSATFTYTSSSSDATIDGGRSL